MQCTNNSCVSPPHTHLLAQLAKRATAVARVDARMAIRSSDVKGIAARILVENESELGYSTLSKLQTDHPPLPTSHSVYQQGSKQQQHNRLSTTDPP